MFGYKEPFAHPVPSFNQPVNPPSSDPDAGDLITVCFAREWLPLVMGALSQLTLQSTWIGDDDAILLAQDRAQLLMCLIAEGCDPGIMFQLRQNPENIYQLQQSFDEGETWTLAYDYSWCLTGETTIPTGWTDDPGTINPQSPVDTWTHDDGETTEETALRTAAFCAAIEALVTAALEVFVKAAEGTMTTLNVLVAIAGVVAAIAAALATGGATAPLIAIALAHAAFAIVEAFANAENIAYAQDPDVRAAMVCIAYLKLRDLPVTPETFQEAFSAPDDCLSEGEEAIRQVLDAMFHTVYLNDLYMTFVNGLGGATLAVKSGYELPECLPCAERTWCYGWYYGEELQSMFNKTAGVWQSYGLEIGAADGGGNWGAYMEMKYPVYVPEQTTVTMIEFFYNRYGITSQTYAVSDGDGTSNSGGFPSSGTWYQIAGVGSYNKSDFFLRVSANQYTNGLVNDGYISAVRITGTGVPLFGICDKCDFPP